MTRIASVETRIARVRQGLLDSAQAQGLKKTIGLFGGTRTEAIAASGTRTKPKARAKAKAKPKRKKKVSY